MIHEYFGVNLQLVWDVVKQELPRLKQEVEIILGTRDERQGSNG